MSRALFDTVRLSCWFHITGAVDGLLRRAVGKCPADLAMTANTNVTMPFGTT
ncbi:hypothetical protein ACRALDRAFT_2015132 [Sodiomyces alcalophilus JCM 7366]|uniref:uncharacterized protein n=1 Tax=Sodiomyces alcalophilus JCM 7366 TaxID=591952 RepID=UPI0039B3C0D2